MKMHLSRNTLCSAFPDVEGSLLAWLHLPGWPWTQQNMPGASRPQAPGGLQEDCSSPQFCLQSWYCQMWGDVCHPTRLSQVLTPNCHSRKGSWSLWLQNHDQIIQTPAVISQCCGPNPKLVAVSDQSSRVNHAPSVLVGWLFAYVKCWVNT